MENNINLRKIAIVGCGFVRAATAYTLMQSGMFSEMVLLDADFKKSRWRSDGYFPRSPLCKTDEHLCGEL